MIPKNIFQFCHDSDAILPIFMKAIRTTKENNPDFQHFLVDDFYMYKFINTYYGKEVFELYKANRIPASRCDLARLMLVYEYGGFYFDLSMEINKSIDSYLPYELVLLQRDDFARYEGREKDAHFTNSIIGARAKLPFIKECIEDVIFNFKNKKYNNDVINASGPGVINKKLNDYRKSNEEKFKIISFKKSKNSFFNYVRDVKFSNTWVEKQKQGIFRE